MSPHPNSHHFSHDCFCLTMIPHLQPRASLTFISSPFGSRICYRWYYIFLCGIHIITSHLLQIALLRSWHSSFSFYQINHTPVPSLLILFLSPRAFLRNSPSLQALTTCHKFPVKHYTGISNRF